MSFLNEEKAYRFLAKRDLSVQIDVGEIIILKLTLNK